MTVNMNIEPIKSRELSLFVLTYADDMIHFFWKCRWFAFNNVEYQQVVTFC